MFFRSVCMAYAFLFFMRYLTMPGVFLPQSRVPPFRQDAAEHLSRLVLHEDFKQRIHDASGDCRAQDCKCVVLYVSERMVNDAVHDERPGKSFDYILRAVPRVYILP